MQLSISRGGAHESYSDHRFHLTISYHKYGKREVWPRDHILCPIALIPTIRTSEYSKLFTVISTYIVCLISLQTSFLPWHSRTSQLPSVLNHLVSPSPPAPSDDSAMYVLRPCPGFVATDLSYPISSRLSCLSRYTRTRRLLPPLAIFVLVLGPTSFNNFVVHFVCASRSSS